MVLFAEYCFTQEAIPRLGRRLTYQTAYLKAQTSGRLHGRPLLTVNAGSQRQGAAYIATVQADGSEGDAARPSCLPGSTSPQR